MIPKGWEPKAVLDRPKRRSTVLGRSARVQGSKSFFTGDDLARLRLDSPVAKRAGSILRCFGGEGGRATGVRVSDTNRSRVTVEDMTIVLMLILRFQRAPNTDGSMPFARFQWAWGKLEELGETKRAYYGGKLSQALRMLRQIGWVQDLDCDDLERGEYVPRWMDPKGKGKACRWALVEEIEQSILREEGEGGVVAGVGHTHILEVIASAVLAQLIPFSPPDPALDPWMRPPPWYCERTGWVDETLEAMRQHEESVESEDDFLLAYSQLL